jgi:toxin ParE1/3/4
MAYEIKLAPQANRDLEEIYQFIHAENSAVAQTWYRGLESAIFSLESMPYRGAAENTALRHLLYGNRPHIYRIIYSIDEQSAQVNVAQIRHGARHPLRAR